VGYGFDSVAAHLEAMNRIETAVADLPSEPALAKRRHLLAEIDHQGLLATPANSFINELVVEAARLSIQHDGAWVNMAYEPAPHVQVASDFSITMGKM
jgi:hypothetical protein